MPRDSDVGHRICPLANSALRSSSERGTVRHWHSRSVSPGPGNLLGSISAVPQSRQNHSHGLHRLLGCCGLVPGNRALEDVTV